MNAKEKYYAYAREAENFGGIVEDITDYVKELEERNAVLGEVLKIIDELYKTEVDGDIFSSHDLIKRNRINEYNNALDDVKNKILSMTLDSPRINRSR